MKAKHTKPILSLTGQHLISAISHAAYIITLILYYVSRHLNNKIAMTMILITVVLLAFVSLCITIASDVLFKKEQEDEGANDSLSKGMILSKGLSLIFCALIIFVWWIFFRDRVIQIGVLDFSLLFYFYICIGETITSIIFLILESSGKVESEE